MNALVRAIEELFVNREERQRSAIFDAEGNFINEDGLLESVEARGVIQPLIITQEGEIICGERRFEAAKLAGHLAVPVRYIEGVSREELELIELDENIRRTELGWRDRVRVVGKQHEKWSASEPSWKQTHTAQKFNLSPQYVSELLRIYKDLANEKILRAKNSKEAYVILTRGDKREERELQTEIGVATRETAKELKDELQAPSTKVEVAETGSQIEAGAGERAPLQADIAERQTPPQQAPEGSQRTPEEAQRFQQLTPKSVDHVPPPSPNLILPCESLSDFALAHSERYNFIHLSKLPVTISREYLCALGSFAASAAHLVVWLSGDFNEHDSLRQAVREDLPEFRLWETPLVWHISNAKKALDAYKCAIVATKGERNVWRSDIENVYHSPQDRKWSEESLSEPMLRHFFALFADENTKFFDPSCGNGASVRAALSHECEVTLGLESDSTLALDANDATKQFLALRKIKL